MNTNLLVGKHVKINNFVYEVLAVEFSPDTETTGARFLAILRNCETNHLVADGIRNMVLLTDGEFDRWNNS